MGVTIRRLRQLLFISLIFIFAPALRAGTLNVPADYSTIQAAIDASVNGDIILVQPGTYVENLNFGGKNILLKSSGATEATVLDGSGVLSVITFNSGEDTTAVIDGFTIKNGGGNTGGGVLIINSSPTIQNSIITENTSAVGGGFYIGTGSPIIRDNVISANTATFTDQNASGIYITSGGSPRIINNIIENNISHGIGGGIEAYVAGDVVIRNNVIRFNTGGVHANGITIWTWISGSVIIENNLIVSNATNALMIVSADVALTFSIINNTISDNGGNGIQLHDTYNQITIKNNILENNTGYGINLTSGINFPISDYNLVYDNQLGNYNNILTGTNDVNENPYFINKGTGDYHLKDWSNAIGVGTVTGAPSIDIESNPRPNPPGSNPDIGAYENVRSMPLHNSFIHVSTTGDDLAGVGFEASPFATIQAAIDYSLSGDTVLVQPGTYFENINFNDKNIVLGSLFLTTQDTSYISSTIIDGNQNGRVITIGNINNSTTELTGVTIQNGNAANGGGILCESNAKINNVIIRNNTAGYGGGIKISSGGTVIISDSEISGNDAIQSLAGGIWVNGSNLILRRTSVLGNYSAYGGGRDIF